MVNLKNYSSNNSKIKNCYNKCFKITRCLKNSLILYYSKIFYVLPQNLCLIQNPIFYLIYELCGKTQKLSDKNITPIFGHPVFYQKSVCVKEVCPKLSFR